MGTHSASGKSRPARVKYVYVSPSDTDTPINGPSVSTGRKATEIGLWQRFRDTFLALAGLLASVLIILGGRVADMALEWQPGKASSPPAVTTEAPAAHSASLLTVPTVTVPAPAPTAGTWH